MAMSGMDVEGVRQLSKDLQAQSASLGDVVATVERLVRTIGSVWHGRDSDQFRQSWEGNHAPALQQAREEIQQLGQTASRNASDQEAASSGSAAGIAASSVSATVPGILSSVTATKNLEIDGIKPWDLITSVGVAGELDGIPGFKHIGTAGDVVQVIEYAEKIQSGTFDVHDGFDVTADVMQYFGPVGNLGGGAIHIWNDAAREAQNVDWSGEAMSQTWDYVRDNPGVLADELGRATVEVGTRFLGYFRIP